MSSEDLTGWKPGDNHYKAYVGPPLNYDIVGAMQFNLLTLFGLRDYHKLLDIGCGSLRAGKLFIPFLRRGNYYGIEPNKWLIEKGIENELGNDILTIKSPKFTHSLDFEFQSFNEKFDFLLAQSIFSHASPPQIQRCLKEAQSVLKKEGFFLATFLVGNNNYSGDEWVYPSCVTYKHRFILKLAEEQELAAFKLKWRHSHRQTWYVFVHPENRSAVNRKLSELNTVTRQSPIRNFIRRQPIINNRITRKIFEKFKSR